MNGKMIAFIICVDNAQYYEECVRYINDLDIPEGYVTDIICIEEADSIAEAYNAGMGASDAKYKVYLHQDTFILNRNFIHDIVQIFESDENIGMLGMLGADHNPPDGDYRRAWNVGDVVEYNGRSVIDTEHFLEEQAGGLREVEAIAGFIMITQYDIPWREDSSDRWDFYNISQSLEMKKRGYKVVVAGQKTPWCYHDSGCTEGNADYDKQAQQIAKDLIKLFECHQYDQLVEIAESMRDKWFLNMDIREVMNLMEIYTLESASVSEIHSEWYLLNDWKEILTYYNWVRFVVLRIEYEREDERKEELKRMVETGRISRDAIRKISAVNLRDTINVYPYLLQQEMEEPLVSVVVAVYNGQDFLEATIDSILNQTYRNIEVIVVDDASTDSSREKILRYKDPRIKTYFLEKNRHVCYAGNVGFENATGKYVALIGHDDMWREDKLLKQVSFLEEHPTYGVCFSWTNIVDEYHRFCNMAYYGYYSRFNADNLGAKRWERRIVCRHNSFCAVSACVRRDVLEKTGYYRYALVQLQDYELWIRVLMECELYILQEKVTFYRRFIQEGKNLSELTPETKARDLHEKQWIVDNFIRNLTTEEFIRLFHEDMRNPNACNEKEIICEKAFFLWKMGNCFMEKWFIELLEDEECREILEKEYKFELKDFYKMNAQPMHFDTTLLDKAK